MSILNELKAEITRLSRREINKELAPVRRVNAAQRGLIANLRREVVALQKEVSAMRRAGSATVVAADKPDERSSFWITGKGIKALRKRLGLTQVQLARLVGVSDQAVVNWESNDRKIAYRACRGKLIHIGCLCDRRKGRPRDLSLRCPSLL